MKEISLSIFCEQLHTAFQVSAPELAEPVELTLLKAVDKGSNPHQEQFSLFFQGPIEPFLPQQTYHFTHGELGELSLFMVPIGKDQAGSQYQVVFNRLRENSAV